MPALGHVWVIVLENRGFEQVVGSPDAPYLNGLIEQHGLAEAFHAVARPSQPNYLALFSGSTHGVTDNEPHHIDAPTLADQIEASGRTWRQHSENVPGDCYDGRQASGGRDGPGPRTSRSSSPTSATTATTAASTRSTRGWPGSSRASSRARRSPRTASCS
jgi:acid phosphatase